MSYERTDDYESALRAEGARALQAKVDAVIAKHVPEWYTEYGIPVFDEFDSDTATYQRCKACHERLYNILSRPELMVCSIVRDLSGD